jgi:hypothetical protein
MRMLYLLGVGGGGEKKKSKNNTIKLFWNK